MHKMLFYGHSGGGSVLRLSVYSANPLAKAFFPLPAKVKVKKVRDKS